MTRERYELIDPKKNAKKFWEITSPEKRIGNGTASWGVRVHFGRIGTNGQTRLKVFWSEWGANRYHGKMIDEKLTKGYKFISQEDVTPKGKPKDVKPMDKWAKIAAAAGPIINPPAVYIPTHKPKPECEHVQLRKTGERKWECNACKTHIEFDKPTTTTVTLEITQVRRFMDFSALRGDS